MWIYLVLAVVIFICVRYAKRRQNKVKSVAFFHPYCNAGGGGEKVLWHGISAIQKRFPDVEVIVYTGDTDAAGEEILDRVRQRFSIVLPCPVRFVFLRGRWLVEASLYPYFTLAGQAFGGFLLGLEALMRFRPDVVVDSMGYPFVAPLFRLQGCRVACYVHYPTISTDMLDMVAQQRPSYNNRQTVTRSAILSRGKLFYYQCFAKAYGLAGRCVDVVMTNSSWTQGHIQRLWTKSQASIVYPPCDVEEFGRLQVESERLFKSEVRVLSVAQFRPEKDLWKQIEVMARLKDIVPQDVWNRMRWVFVGGCRNEEDRQLVKSLEDLAAKLGVEDKVEFKQNLQFSKLKQELSQALIGAHTMWNEHFGIGVVESMAAGNIIVAHNSGGPKLDIVVSPDGRRTAGFLAESVDQYASTIANIISMSADERQSIRESAKKTVARFSESNFCKEFCEALTPIIA